jgi:hypothetical protein
MLGIAHHLKSTCPQLIEVEDHFLIAATRRIDDVGAGGGGVGIRRKKRLRARASNS